MLALLRCAVPWLQVLETDAAIAEIHANSESFDPKSELSFKYLQVRALPLVLSALPEGLPEPTSMCCPLQPTLSFG